jgi:predicted outer membrane protein
VTSILTGGVPKFVRILIVVVFVAMAGLATIAYVRPETFTIGYQDHNLGAIGPADRDMLFKVKQAGLWEMPVGQEASQRATTEQFRNVARRMADEHHQLDIRVEQVAAQLGVVLPKETTPDQQSWMRQISGSSSGEYDRTAVYLLRAAHGKILPALANVRSGSRNELVRQFADEAYAYVNRHMGYLESTGLVNFSELPEPPTPSPYQQPAEASYYDSRNGATIFITIGIISLVAILVTLLVKDLLKAEPVKRVGNSHTRTGPQHLKPKG